MNAIKVTVAYRHLMSDYGFLRVAAADAAVFPHACCWNSVTCHVDIQLASI